MASDLSEAARELLLEASRDPSGMILRSGAMRWTYLRTNRRILGGPDEQERWESAIKELLRLGLIEPQGDKVFCVTPEGYQAADAFRNQDRIIERSLCEDASSKMRVGR